MTIRAAGSFEVTLAALDHSAGESTLGRMSLDKVFHGDLEGTGKGEMLTAGTSVTGSAVYVAIERVTGTLHGRTGSFALHHVGVMTRGTPELTIAIVPDSGTGELAGIAGTLAIKFDAGKHFYEVAYQIPGIPDATTAPAVEPPGR
jgi:hypothetical protein